jgi:DNA-binding beta-propeller fold protein YncE
MLLFYLLATILIFSPSLNASDESDYIYIDVGGGNSTGENIPAITAQISSPAAVAVDPFRNIYIAEFFANYIKKVDSTGKITTFAGNGIGGYNGDNIFAKDASLYGPHSLAFDKPGSYLYIAEYYGHRVRKIDMKTLIITTVAGTGVAGFSGDGGLATNAQLNTLPGVAIDMYGNIYIADFANNRVRKVEEQTKKITTFAGTGVEGFSGDGVQAGTAEFHGPYSLAVNCAQSDYIYISETFNNQIRRVDLSSRLIRLIASVSTMNFDGPLIAPGPRMLTADEEGNLYYSDIKNNVVKRMDISFNIHVFAGNGDTTFNGDPHIAVTAALHGPLSLAHDNYGKIYITEFLGSRVRHVARNASPPPTQLPTASPPPTQLPTASPPPTQLPTASPPPTQLPTASPPPTQLPTASLSKCAAGYYLSTPKKCKPCPLGMWSTAGATVCTACPAGTHTSQHLSCEDCKPGEYSEAMWRECKFCGVGTVSKGKAKACTVCPAGTYAHHQDNDCKPCPQYQWSQAMSDECGNIVK